MASRIEALVKPELIVWARETAGLSVEQAAKKAKVPVQKLESWESGEKLPSIPELRRFAEACKRPLAAFYLPAPPPARPTPSDFRRHPGIPMSKSPELTHAIRQAQSRREVALELYQDLGESPTEFNLRVTLSTPIEDAAKLLRKALGVSIETQQRWATTSVAFASWRQALESVGLLVFQAQRVDTSEMRGFSLAEPPLPVVVVNQSDANSAKCFSLFHEVGHIMLRSGGLCDFGEDLSNKEAKEVEVFCNALAATFLAPADALLDEALVKSHSGSAWADSSILALAKRFKVSQEVILRRLLTVGKTDKAFYESRRALYLRAYDAISAESEEEARVVRIPAFRRVLSETGQEFARLVLQGYAAEVINASDLSDFLGMKLQHLPKLEAALLR